MKNLKNLKKLFNENAAGIAVIALIAVAILIPTLISANADAADASWSSIRKTAEIEKIKTEHTELYDQLATDSIAYVIDMESGIIIERDADGHYDVRRLQK